VHLKISAASKAFGQLQALAAVDLSVESGQFVVLLGPSGSGKTTLLRCVAGLETLDSGEIWLGDQLVAAPARRLHLPPERRRIGMVFQEYALWPHLSAEGNVGLPLREARLPDWRERAQAALERVGLGANASRFPHQLSGGQQQRVALARALARAPELLLFDEPLSNLDAQLREELRLEIAEIVRAQRTTTLYITHDQQEAFFLADRVGVMRAGRLLQYASPEQVYRHPADLFVAQFTGAQGPLEVEARSGQLYKGSCALGPAAPQLCGMMQLVVHAEDIGLTCEGSPGVLPATALYSAFCGERYQCWLRLEGGEQLQAYSAQRLDPGCRVWLRLSPQGLLAFPREERT
jgi:ABC-type Fe3+/spermidine/putrescine transport system ATPase subunit